MALCVDQAPPTYHTVAGRQGGRGLGVPNKHGTHGCAQVALPRGHGTWKQVLAMAPYQLALVHGVGVARGPLRQAVLHLGTNTTTATRCTWPRTLAASTGVRHVP